MNAPPSIGGLGLRFTLLTLALAGVALLSLDIGHYPLSVARVARIVTGRCESCADVETMVVWQVRAPRVALAMLGGAALALSGAVLQGVFRNPLVGPQIVGVANGASFGAVLALLFGLTAPGVIGAAFAFGLGALAAVFGLSRIARGPGTVTLILAGMVTGAFFTALVGAVQFFSDPETKLPGIVYWLLGSFVGASPDRVYLLGAVVAVAGGLLLLLRWRINLLSLDDDDAEALGVRVGALRWLVLALASALVAGQVAVSGGIGWVGLVVPHFGRMIFGPDHRILAPACVLIGALYLLIVDDAARGLATQEIPIGILTALVGAPVFAVLLWRKGVGGWSRD